MRQFLIAASLCAAAVAAAVAYVPDVLEAARKPPKPTVASVEKSIANLERRVAVMEQTADRYAKWKKCVTWVPVNEVGDPDNRYGYNYDERDGTGLTFTPALVVAWEDETPEYTFLQFARRGGCQSQPVQPGGTGEDAKVGESDAVRTAPVSSSDGLSQGRPPSTGEDKIRALERRVRLLGERAKALERMSTRFDQWESCLSWVPVTEFGDADNRFGYLFGEEGAAPGTGPRSPWTPASATTPTTSSSPSWGATVPSPGASARASPEKASTEAGRRRSPTERTDHAPTLPTSRGLRRRPDPGAHRVRRRRSKARPERAPFQPG